MRTHRECLLQFEDTEKLFSQKSQILLFLTHTLISFVFNLEVFLQSDPIAINSFCSFSFCLFWRMYQVSIVGFTSLRLLVKVQWSFFVKRVMFQTNEDEIPPSIENTIIFLWQAFSDVQTLLSHPHFRRLLEQKTRSANMRVTIVSQCLSYIESSM